MSSRSSLRVTGSRSVPAALAAVLVALALAATACNSATAPTPTYTEFPIGPQPWPNGTVGQYGLHIDPTLLSKLPKTVDAYPLTEDAETETLALDDPDLANTLDTYAAAQIGIISDPNWLNLVIGHFKSYDQNPDTYPDVLAAWINQYATGACSQASAVAASGQETINGFLVDTATCAGGPVVYTLPLGNGVVVSMFGLGPRDLGRKLIMALY